MRGAAELGALTPVLAGRVGAKLDAVDPTLDQVAFAGEPRHPKAVDDVGRRHLELDWGPHRDVQLVRGTDPQRRVAILPPPLMADDLDPQRALGCVARGLENRAHRGNGDEHEDQRRRERPANLERRVAVHRLRRRGTRSRAIARDRVQQQRFDDDEDDHCPPKNVGEQVVERSAEIRSRRERRLWERSAAGGEHDQNDGKEQRHGVKD